MDRRPKQTDEIKEWLTTRPDIIRKIADQIPPLGVYELVTDVRPEESYYRLISYAEDGTVTMARFIRETLRYVYSVFGLDPNDLKLVGETDPVTGRVEFYETSNAGS